MNKCNDIATTIGLMAENMSKDAYKASEDCITDEDMPSPSNRDSLSGKHADISLAEARENERVAAAEPELHVQPIARP